MQNFVELLEKLGALAAERGGLFQREASLWAELGRVLRDPVQLETVSVKQAGQPTSNGGNPTEMLSTKDAAAALNLSPSTLTKWRLTGGGPKYAKLGGRVFYRRTEIDLFVASKIRRNTSE